MNTYYLKSELVEIVIANTAQKRFNFEDIDILRNKIITRFDAFTALTSTNNRTVVSTTILNKSFLTLSRLSREFVSRLPLRFLDSAQNNGVRVPILSAIDLPKSYIEIPENSGLTAGQSFLFQVWYYDRIAESSAIQNIGRQIDMLPFRTDIIEVEVKNTFDRIIYFKDNDFLRQKKIIEIFRNETVTIAPSGKTIVADAIYNKAFVTLNRGGKDFINKAPANEFKISTSYEDNRLRFPGLMFDFPKSYITLGNVSSVVAGTVFLFTVKYIE